MAVTLHHGFDTMFAEGRLTLGLFMPIEAYQGSIPTMENHLERVRCAEQLGFAALWVRDVPLYDPSFGDVGQMYDPWVYLGCLAMHTQTIALATGSIVLPLRHPLHVAKAAASVDQLSGGRLVLGVGAGDRLVEFPAFGLDANDRGDRFRDSFRVLRRVLEAPLPDIESPLGSPPDLEVLPKPVTGKLPLLVTGSSRQSMEWIAEQSDGWITYPRPLALQSDVIASWKRLAADSAPGRFKPFVQSLYIDLADDRHATPTPIHLGYRLGSTILIEMLKQLEARGVNHVILNLKYGRRPTEEVVEELGEEVVPEFAKIRERRVLSSATPAAHTPVQAVSEPVNFE